MVTFFFLLKCLVFGYCNIFCVTIIGFWLQYLFWVPLRILGYNKVSVITVPCFRLVYGNMFLLQYILWVTLHIQSYNNVVWVSVPCFRLALGNTFCVTLTHFVLQYILWVTLHILRVG